MITQAYYRFQNAMRGLTYRDVTSSGNSFTTTLTNVKNTSNTDAIVSNGMITYTTDWNNVEKRIYNANNNTETIDVVIPSSSTSTDFASTDYDIGNKISNITQLTCTNSIIDTLDGSQNIVTATFSNSNSSDITINSIGLIHKHLYLSTVGSSDSYTEILFAEIELDSPLIVPAGSGFSITAVWKNNR